MSEISKANFIIAQNPQVFMDARYNMMNKMFLCTFWTGTKTWLSATDIINEFSKREEQTELSVDDLLDLYNIATKLENTTLKEEVKKELKRRTGHGFKESK